MFTRSARIAQETGATLLPSVPPVLQLPAGAFPFKVLKAFGMINVDASNETSFDHYDPNTRALLGRSLIGAPPTNNVSSIDAINGLLVGGDFAADCVWWVDPVAMAVSPPITPMGAHVRDVITCGNYLLATSDTGGWLKKIDPATRAVIDTLTIPGAFRGAYDGHKYLYVACNAQNELAQIDVSVTPMVWTATWSTLFTLPNGITVGQGPWGVDCAGDYVWCADEGAGNPAGGAFNKINPLISGAAAVRTFAMGTGNAPHSVRVIDGKVYGADANAGQILVLDEQTGAVIEVISTGPNAIGITFDGESLISTCGNNNTVEFRQLKSLFF